MAASASSRAASSRFAASPKNVAAAEAGRPRRRRLGEGLVQALGVGRRHGERELLVAEELGHLERRAGVQRGELAARVEDQVLHVDEAARVLHELHGVARRRVVAHALPPVPASGALPIGSRAPASGHADVERPRRCSAAPSSPSSACTSSKTA